MESQAKRKLERYLSPESGMMATIVRPASSRAILMADASAAPDDMPRSTPSVRPASRAISIASSSATCSILSYTLLSSTEGMNPAPIPWILCGPGLPPERTGEEAGSTATTCTDGFNSFRKRPVPVMVPPRSHR